MPGLIPDSIGRAGAKWTIVHQLGDASSLIHIGRSFYLKPMVGKFQRLAVFRYRTDSVWWYTLGNIGLDFDRHLNHGPGQAG